MTTIIISFTISVVLGPFLILMLKKQKAGQVVREDGPYTHLEKNGTPTMGGILILISVFGTCFFYYKEYPRIIPILLMMLGFGMIGFLDDFIKIFLKRSMGLTALQKLFLQIIVTGCFAYYMKVQKEVPLTMKVPFLGREMDFGIWTFPVLFFIALGTVNGSNLTDGLDGLLSSVTVLTSTFFSVMAVGEKSGLEPVTLALTGSLLGFLLFNIHPALVFLGDTGSLAIGGYLVAVAYMMRLPLYLPIVGFIYMIEVLSVIIQVVYYKVSGGKRLFKMAPIHHHFELCGFRESQIVLLFGIITAFLSLIALYK